MSYQHDAFQGGAFQFGAIVVSSGGDATVTPGVGSLVLTGFAATLTAASSVTPGVGSLTIAGLAPSVSAAFAATPITGSLALTGLLVTLDISHASSPGVGSLALTGLGASVSIGADTSPAVGVLTLVGFDPTVSVSSGSVDATVTPDVGALVLTGYAVSVSVASLTPSQDFYNVLDPPIKKGPTGQDWLRKRQLEKEAHEKREADLLEALRLELKDIDEEIKAREAKPKGKASKRIEPEAMPDDVPAIKARKPSKRVSSDVLLQTRADALREAIANAKARAEQIEQEAVIMLLLAA